jgi:hypothetical protein
MFRLWQTIVARHGPDEKSRLPEQARALLFAAYSNEQATVMQLPSQGVLERDHGPVRPRWRHTMVAIRSPE